MKITLDNNSTKNPMVTREEARASFQAATDEIKAALGQAMRGSEYAIGMQHAQGILHRHFSRLLQPKKRTADNA
jgi:hypothetical protein